MEYNPLKFELTRTIATTSNEELRKAAEKQVQNDTLYEKHLQAVKNVRKPTNSVKNSREKENE